MRLRALVPLALVAMAPLLGCDDRNPTLTATLGGVGPSVAGVGFTSGNSFGFAITPSSAHLVVGDRLQLVATVRDTLGTAIQWRSLHPRVARVTNDGLVTAIGPGRATIIAQFTADTNIVAPATIFVSGVFIP